MTKRALSDDAKPDYTTMSGAEFKRAVGADPEKWAEAFDKEAGRLSAETGGYWPHNREERIEFLASWFRDYGEAVLAAIGNPYGLMEVIPTPERRREIAKDALERANDPTRGILD